ncbi:DNA circularization protein [Escherichia coli]|uniref:DNA circularization protein n=1 Tax=Escherichia coli TaxID=562 RepID=UPI0007B609EB|nr:DNA circularization N-terminal domain-containing protein [Escherichia coli]
MTTSKGKWDGLRDASFRGVPFFLVDTEGTGGRRAIPRAYPRRETAWTDDNGAVPGQQQINAKLPGKNFQDDLNALLDALNTPGPGELIHPWFGIQTVQVGKVTHRLSTEEDGIAYVTFEVFEAGERLFPSAADNTQQEVLTGIDAVKAAIDDGDWFGALDGLGEMADSFLADMENLVANLPTLPAALNQWMDRLNHFKEMAGTIIATPGRLVSELSSFIDGVVDLVTEPPEALAVYTTLRNQWAGERARQVATGALPEDITVKPGSVTDGEPGFAIGLSPAYQPVSDSLQKNIDDFRQVVVLETLLGQANAVASMTFDTSDAALSAGDTLAAELHEQAVAAVENNQRALWRTLRDLRQAVITDARERAARLPETRQVTLTTTTSAALLAWREHGDTSRRDEIVQRNRLRHPSFILPTQPVEITD